MWFATESLVSEGNIPEMCIEPGYPSYDCNLRGL